MINTIKLPRAYSEVYSFINALGENYIKEIPKVIYDKIKNERDLNYNIIYDKDKEISVEDISKEALALIAAINLQYWCKDEKEELKKIYINNTKLEKEKYSYDNLFKKNTENEANTSVALVEYKENFLTKIINKIKNFFKKNK